MNTSIKMPLSVYVLYHKDYKEGKEIYTDMYHLLCRNPECPLTDGIDIPVFLRTGGDGQEIPKITLNQSSKNVILLLVDEFMYCCSLWKVYIQYLLSVTDDNTKIYPISLFKHAYDINSVLKTQQFITLKSFSIKENWNEFQTRIFDILIRFITGKDSNKLKLFISHSKKELYNLGEIKAKELRDFLRTDTKLDSFFDANDIVDGYDFENQIKENVEKSLFIILETNTYAEREWCRIEALAGKRNRVPGIVVSLFNGIVKRGFPYIGNVPVIRYNDNWVEVINLLLRTALDQYYQEKLLTEVRASIAPDDYCILPFAPELLSFSLIDKTKKILYPEPPLGSEEIDFLKIFDDGASFMTPMQAFSEVSQSLKDRNIAISISESDDIQKYGGDEALLRDITIELSRHILVAGGKLVYGGDLRQQGFTELFVDLSYQYGQHEKTDRDTKYFTNYFAWPIHLNLTKTHESDFEHSRVSIMKVEAPKECPAHTINNFVAPNSPENSFLWAKSLTKMRLQMEENVNARILLGGRTHGFKGRYAGVFEEFIITQNKEHPIYLLGGFGGASKAIVDIIEGNIPEAYLFEEANKDLSYKDFFHYYNEKEDLDPIDYTKVYNEVQNDGISGLRNGLSDEENRLLFYSTNVLEIVALILKGLNNKFQTI
ncbi:hypothetical protein [Sphingobacterium kitahiroshimense]|uniref:hypothetical protein n=1 Tax=Sphingobacterium kitahiroshimense TaxID=470446 RepID=UPI00320AB639